MSFCKLSFPLRQDVLDLQKNNAYFIIFTNYRYILQIQCAGETTYTDDLQVQPREVHAAFALSTVSVGDIVHIDASQALV